jgi:hypothetical protein
MWRVQINTNSGFTAEMWRHGDTETRKEGFVFEIEATLAEGREWSSQGGDFKTPPVLLRASVSPMNNVYSKVVLAGFRQPE